jgi:hypothetical protein
MKCPNEQFNVFFAFVCTNMSDIPNRTRLGKEMMTNSLRKEREEANPHIPKRGRHRNLGGVESSHAAQSQVVDPTPMVVYDTRDEGYNPTE